MKRYGTFSTLFGALMIVLGINTPTTVSAVDAKLGGLTCKTLQGSGLNLIFHSSRDVRCTFKDNSGSEQWYMGETGVGLGVDLKWTALETIYLGVLSSTHKFAPEGAFLSGSYGGAKADAAIGAGAGVQVLLGGASNTIALQPAVETSSGAGVSAGLGYLNLKPDPLNQARTVTPRGSNFASVLYSGYFDRSHKFHNQNNYKASDYLSAKAIQAAGGQPPAPDLGNKWKINQAERRVIDASRERLVKALDHADWAPIDTAHAQVNYDCMLYTTGNTSTKSVLTTCRKAFESHMASAEAKISETLAKLKIEAEIKAMAIRNLEEPSYYLVLFPTDHADLDKYAAVTINKVIERLGQLDEAAIFLSGNTDRTGTKPYNLDLSERRNESVETALLSAGLPKTWILSEAFGEENPIRKSRDPSDALNRRVEVVVQPVKVKTAAIEIEEQRLRMN